MPAPNPLIAKPLSDADDAVVRAFVRSLRAAGKSPRTVQSYEESARLLAGFLDDVDLEAATKADLEKFMIFLQENWSATTAAVRFRSLQQIYGWLASEDYITVSPLAGMKAPKPTTKPVPVSDDDDLRRLVAACKGPDVYDLRDTALIRLLIDTGVRVAELCGLSLADLDMRADLVTVHGKGDKIRMLPFGSKTGQALERYLRARARHPQGKSPHLWVAARGKPLTPSGVTQLLERRCAQAGIDRINPHRFRHTAAHTLMAAGLGDSDAMRLFGWTSRDMVARYGSSAADERARDAHRRLSPGDRI